MIVSMSRSFTCEVTLARSRSKLAGLPPIKNMTQPAYNKNGSHSRSDAGEGLSEAEIKILKSKKVGRAFFDGGKTNT